MPYARFLSLQSIDILNLTVDIPVQPWKLRKQPDQIRQQFVPQVCLQLPTELPLMPAQTNLSLARFEVKLEIQTNICAILAFVSEGALDGSKVRFSNELNNRWTSALAKTLTPLSLVETANNVPSLLKRRRGVL